MTESISNLLTVSDAASLLCVTPQTLRSWEKKGVLVPYRNPVNKYRVYKTSQIEEFLEKMSEERRRSGKFKLKVQIIRTKKE